ncbi:MAG: aminotransferase DegT [Ignavibacteria bacterium RIFOXYA12_FULL_35_25]|nr:MAG: aminotransferase DegT [Ignavibacteria bacterium GWF2_35_20]OGU85755.1 MAG: aminotransferase DegT [Ignavibacteria bacterium RIFOXYA12_FULL_35_25]OGV31057.1 MAG: aminotransferase DegT [Ignavibacteria bacterium RIFOXYD12_FULL_36_8]
MKSIISEQIPLSVPYLSGREWEYVKNCLDSSWVSTAGSFVSDFERVVAKYTGCEYGIAVMNGTSALHLALKIMGVKPEEEVIVPTITFIASINSIKYVGAHPVFMDADQYYNIDPMKTVGFLLNETYQKDKCCYNKRTNRKIAAIMPVHVFGNAVDIETLVNVCNELNILIVEDATESIGTRYISGKYAGKHTGSIGDIGCISFNGNKIITTGAGGMIITDNPEYAEKAKYFSTQAKDDEIRFIHNDVGYNYRMTNVQAAIGLAQMENLDNYINTKEKNYTKYKNEIDSIPGLRLNETPPYAKNNNWMYALQINEKIYNLDIESTISLLSKRMIQSRPIWYPNHLQLPYMNEFSYNIQNALELHKATINLPCSVNLTELQINHIINSLKNK